MAGKGFVCVISLFPLRRLFAGSLPHICFNCNEGRELIVRDFFTGQFISLPAASSFCGRYVIPLPLLFASKRGRMTDRERRNRREKTHRPEILVSVPQVFPATISSFPRSIFGNRFLLLPLSPKKKNLPPIAMGHMGISWIIVK